MSELFSINPFKIFMYFTLSVILISSSVFAAVIEKPFFYEVSKDNKKSYVLGTIHGGVTIENLPPAILAYLQSSQTVFVESAYPKELLVGFLTNRIAATAKYGSFKGAPLNQDQKKRLENFWKVPAALSKIATSENCHLLYFNAPISGIVMDFQIQKIALDSNKRLKSLDDEKLEDAAHAAEDECDLRKAVYENPDAVFAEEKLLLAEYINGNEKKMAEGADDESNVIRNRGWIPKLENDFANGSAFVAVGAAHLFGRSGILKHFQSKGYSIRRLK